MRNLYWMVLLLACESGGEGAPPSGDGSPVTCREIVASDYGDYTVEDRFGDAVINSGSPSLHVEEDQLTLSYTSPSGDEVVVTAAFAFGEPVY